MDSELTNHVDAQSSKSTFCNPEDMQTIKAKNQAKDFNKSELLKLMCYMEGELQARDVVIAVLKSEKVKNLMNVSYGSIETNKVKQNDPQAALFRDTLAQTGNLASRHTSAIVSQSERDARELCEQQLQVLSQKVDQQRHTHSKVVNLLKFTRDRHLKLMLELEEERKKNEQKLEPGEKSERSQLLQKVTEAEATRDQLENEIKKLKETLEGERTEHKEIIIYLMEERKKINMIRNEERKRSEDLAQILSEEKHRVDTIADGLEEETKKSLRLESEMEKQSQIHEQERKIMLRNFAAEEKKVKDLEIEIIRLRMDNEALKKTALGSGMGTVSKVIQPTATVSSIPVTGPTTGIARSISPGQVLRQDSSNAMTAGNVATIIRAHSVQQAANQPPQPPVKKNQYGAASSARAPPPIPPNKPLLLNKSASIVTTSSSRVTNFLQSQTSTSAPTSVSQNVKEGDE